MSGPTETLAQNHYYTLQSNKSLKNHGVTMTISDMKTVQKYKRQNI